MIPLFVRRAGVALAMAGVGMLGAASAANADAGPNGAAVGAPVGAAVAAPAAAQAAAPAWSATFDRYLTAGLWNAAQSGVGAVSAYCGSVVPGFLRGPCFAIATSSMLGQFVRLGPPNGRCLNIAPRLGIPPYRLSYITC